MRWTSGIHLCRQKRKCHLIQCKHHTSWIHTFMGKNNRGKLDVKGRSAPSEDKLHKFRLHRTQTRACLPDISTTLSAEADGNFSFSICAMRTSPSVCVDRPLRTWPGTTTWGGAEKKKRGAMSRESLGFASQIEPVSPRRGSCYKCIYLRGAEDPQGRGDGAAQAPSTGHHGGDSQSVRQSVWPREVD